MAARAMSGRWLQRSLRRGPAAPHLRAGGLRTCAAGAADSSTAAPGAEPELPPAPKARPLSIPDELCLYESPEDLGACARRTRARSFVGVGMGCLGFAGVMVGSAATTTVGMKAALCAGAAAYVYKSVVLSTGSMTGAALLHVERIALEPVPDGPPAEGAGDEGATMEERLEATPEVQVKIRTANLDVWVKLVEPVGSWEGGRYEGFVQDDRPVFGNLFDEKQGVLYLDADVAAEHSELLQAVTSSRKVVAERRLEVRRSVESLLKLPADGARLAENLLFPIKKPGTASQPGSQGRRGTPSQEISSLGAQSIFSGTLFLGAGLLFVGRSLAEDPNNPKAMKDLTVGDMLKRIRSGGPERE